MGKLCGARGVGKPDALWRELSKPGRKVSDGLALPTPSARASPGSMGVGYSGMRLIRRTNQPLPCPAAGFRLHARRCRSGLAALSKGREEDGGAAPAQEPALPRAPEEERAGEGAFDDDAFAAELAALDVLERSTRVLAGAAPARAQGPAGARL